MKIENRTLKKIVLILLVVIGSSLAAQTPVYLDESLPLDERVDDVIQRMTETEKQTLLNSYRLPQTSGIPRLGIQPFVVDLEPNLLFPSFECLAATWNPELSWQYGCKAAEQALYRHSDRLYDPQLSAMCDDPYLLSKMMNPYIEGVHSCGVEVFFDGEDMDAIPSADDRLRTLVGKHLTTCMNRQRPLGLLGTEEQKDLSRTLAEEGIVLLKNDPALLPLKGNIVRSLWIVGDEPMNGLAEQIARYGLTVRCENFSLAEVLAETGNPDIVVFTENVSERPSISFLKNTPVVVQAWDLGENGVSALASVLCGEVNPSGKLPFQWDGPQEDQPLFALGHGLSYSSFEFSDFVLSSREVPIGGDIIGMVTVTNTGAREGSEVVQLYIHDIKSSVPKPDKELKGFQKVTLKPGESKELTFVINEELLMFFNEETQQWWAEPGFYVAFVGNAADQLPLKARFHLK